MLDFKISLITVTFNAQHTIERCIQSIIGQKFKNIEYIVIDGGSTDDTLDIISKYKSDINILISEPDKGIYDAMNKGIKLATGDVVGMLNADDYFVDNAVLAAVAEVFKTQNTNIMYADLDYVNPADDIIRKWRSGDYNRLKLNFGWMPPHPTFYCKRQLFEQFGFYSLNFGSAADYELMLRFMYLHRENAFYLNKIIIKMKIGGISNKSYFNRVKGLYFDFKAMRNNGIVLPVLTIFLKPLRKISQYF